MYFITNPQWKYERNAAGQLARGGSAGLGNRDILKSTQAVVTNISYDNRNSLGRDSIFHNYDRLCIECAIKKNWLDAEF